MVTEHWLVYQGYFKQKPYHIHLHGIRAISVEFLGNNVVHERNLLENWNDRITTWNVGMFHLEQSLRDPICSTGCKNIPRKTQETSDLLVSGDPVPMSLFLSTKA